MNIFTASGSGSGRQFIYGGSGQGSLASCDEPHQWWHVIRHILDRYSTCVVADVVRCC